MLGILNNCFSIICGSTLWAISLLCVGSIPILGVLQSALQGDNTFLQINTIFSGITSLILASTFGIGIIFSAFILMVIEVLVFFRLISYPSS
nr:DUF554 family protein [Paenibacillus xylanexedens]